MDFTVIIPHWNSIELLKRAVSSIPDSNNVQILIVDNSPQKISDMLFDDIRSNVKIMYSDPNRGAGCARNYGIRSALGNWLLFLDADDYFTEEAFDTFYSVEDSDADIIYFCTSSCYSDTGLSAERDAPFNRLVSDFKNGVEDAEVLLRLKYNVAWGKMFSREFVVKNQFEFDEVPASNDVMFALKTGYHAKKICVINKKVYCVTVTKGSLTNKKSKENNRSRFDVQLRYNAFLRKNELRKYQSSVMIYIVSAFRFGFKEGVGFLVMCLKSRNNPFIGITRWGKTFFSVKKENKKNRAYIEK